MHVLFREASVINGVSTRLTATRRGQSRRGGFTLVELLVVIAVILLLIAMLLPGLRRGLESARQVTCLDHLRQIGLATLMYCQENDGQLPGLPAVEPGPGFGGPLPYEWIYAEQNYSAPFNDVTKSPVMRYLARKDPAVLRCPSDNPTTHFSVTHAAYGPYAYSYAINEWIAQPPPTWDRFAYKAQFNIWWAIRISEVKNESQKVMYLEEDPRFIDDGAFWNWSFQYPDPENVSPPPFEPPSYVHDTYREEWNKQSRSNVVFCDGHAEFVNTEILVDRAHYDPHY